MKNERVMADTSRLYIAALAEAKRYELVGELQIAVKWLRKAESRTSDSDELRHLIVWRMRLERGVSVTLVPWRACQKSVPYFLTEGKARIQEL